MLVKSQYEKMADYWGPLLNMTCCEEAGEFIQILSKLRRYEEGIGVKEGTNYKDLRQDLINELGDLEICIEMLMIRYNITTEDIASRIKEKANRKYE